jgi:phosphatidylglycerol:prolipoprotein diacylglycerol transferase
MHPILIDFGWHTLPYFGSTHLFLPTYGALFATGALLAWVWFVKRAKALGLPQDPVFNLAFYTLLAGLFGAKLALVLVDLPYYLEHPGDLLGTIRSAGVLMAGIGAGAIAFVVYARAQKLPVFELGDAIAAPLALAQGIGRLGCFAAGCCWGVETSGWCAVTFTSDTAHAQTGVPLDVALVPVQLLQAGFDLSLCLFLTWMGRRRPRPAGTVFWTYLILYGVGRGSLELLRGDAVRGVWFGGVSTSQIFSAIAVIVGAAFLIVSRRRQPARA